MTSDGPMGALRRFIRPTARAERCELCSLLLPSEHPHLLELASRKVACACFACSLLFWGPGPARFRHIPRGARRLPDFQLPEVLWDGLRIPINLAFLFRHSAADRAVALYPSPAGATEALLSLETWPALVELNPAVGLMQPDVEALLVNRLGEGEYYIAPIDECFRLVGLVRSHWRGLSGGTEAWQEVRSFFARLRQCATPEEGTPCPT